MRRVITLSLGLAMFGAAAGQGLGAENCVFAPAVGNVGIWGDGDNWNTCATANGYPTSADNAEIPDGKTCKVESDQHALSIDIKDGGLVRVIEVGLQLHGGDCTVNGTLRLESDNSAKIPVQASLEIAADTLIDSSNQEGIITGLSDELYYIVSSFKDLTIGEDLKVQSYPWFTSIDLTNNGLIRAIGTNDEIGLDVRNLSGTGIFLAVNGLIEVVEIVDFPNLRTQELEWKVTGSGGKFEIKTSCNGCDEFRGDVIITNGTMDVDNDFCTPDPDTLLWTGGTIDVASGSTAEFHEASCP